MRPVLKRKEQLSGHQCAAELPARRVFICSAFRLLGLCCGRGTHVKS
jgi:hypothetical protein